MAARTSRRAHVSMATPGPLQAGRRESNASKSPPTPDRASARIIIPRPLTHYPGARTIPAGFPSNPLPKANSAPLVDPPGLFCGSLPAQQRDILTTTHGRGPFRCGVLPQNASSGIQIQPLGPTGGPVSTGGRDTRRRWPSPTWYRNKSRELQQKKFGVVFDRAGSARSLWQFFG